MGEKLKCLYSQSCVSSKNPYKSRQPVLGLSHNRVSIIRKPCLACTLSNAECVVCIFVLEGNLLTVRDLIVCIEIKFFTTK